MFKCGFYPSLNFTILFLRNISLLCYDKNSLTLVLNLKPKPVFEKEYKRQPIRCRVQPIRCRVQPIRCRVQPIRCRVQPIQCRVQPIQCRAQLSLLVELVYDYKRWKIYESSLKREHR